MISIVGHSDHEDENVAAQKLKSAFLQWRPDLESNLDNVLILVAVQAPGSRSQQDIDLVVLTRFYRPLEVDWTSSGDRGAKQKIPIWSFCATFEVKGHELRRADGFTQVRFQDNKVDVWYKLGGWHPASLQAAGQGKAFSKRLRRETGTSLWTNSFVWLLRVNSEQLVGSRLNEPNGVMPAAFDIVSLGKKILDLDNPTPSNNGSKSYKIWVRDLDFDIVAKHLTATAAISPLNRAAIDKVIRRRIDFKQFELLGKQQQVVIGRAGSGKTMVLLRTALEFYETGKRVALLTYNKTLVADVNRLLMFMKLKGPSHEPNVNIITLHSYFIAVIRVLFAEKSSRIDKAWLNEEYPKLLKEAVAFLREGAASREDIRDGLIKQDFALFDIACIDEGQDWLDDERDLLHLTVGSENCIVASGFDQLVRQDRLCDWSRGGAVDTGQTRLRKCLRMKSALATFANVVAEELKLPGWEVEPDDDMSGGNVILKFGDYAQSEELHRQLIISNAKDGNKNIDILFCVEPGNINDAKVGQSSKLAAQLRDLGHTVWDATIDENREDPPESVEDFRVVQYESCRGLEGWIVVAEHLDEFFRKKMAGYRPDPSAEPSFLRDDEAAARAAAGLWSMIPLTRAIDTIVITIRSDSSILGKALLAAATRLPDVVSVYR